MSTLHQNPSAAAGRAPTSSRSLPLTRIAPDIVAAILDGHQPRGLSINRMLQNVPEAWDEQRRLWEFPAGR